MRLEDIHQEWAKDSQFTVLELEHTITDVPKLHAKYLRYMSEEKLLLRKMEEERKIFVKLKHDYYQGILPEEDLKENGWEPFRLKVLKSDLGMYIESDKEIVKMNLKMAAQQEKVDVLEQIIRHISNRGFLIKSAIDWEKFKVGA